MKEYWDNRFINEKEIWGNLQSKTAELCLQYFLKHEIKSILVPGSGYGRNAGYFLKNGLSVDGIEISKEAVKIALGKGMPFQVYEGSVLDMPFSSKKYEGIFCFNVLHLFNQENRRDFIDKCYEQTVDGGIVFFAVFSEKEPSFGKGERIEENTFETKKGRPVHYFTDDDLKNHFKSFSIIDSGLIEDFENHGAEGEHTHTLRYIIAQKKAHHEFDGQKYKQASSHQKEWGGKIISEFNFTGNESILDLGCGDGVLTKKLSELVPNGETIGIDASEGMIKTAKELETERLLFIKLDIDNLNFEDKFDLIFSNAALHWVKNHKNLLDNCHKALKKNGILRFNFAGDGNGSNFHTVIREIISQEKYIKYFNFFEWPWFMPSIDEYRILVMNSDFEDIKIWDENADRYFADEEEMIKWIDQPAIVPFLKLVDDEDKQNFRDDVISKTIERTRHPDGRCFETFRRINIRAVKK